MSRLLSKDRWSDRGDPVLARRCAWMWVFIALAAAGVVGLVRFAWQIAQDNDYQDNFRGFEAGDPFPWVFVILTCAVGVGCLVLAAVQAARARYLAQRGTRTS